MLVDSFGRSINYLRLSVTDRCDFRCVYCMAEEMEFVPRQQLLTIEEMSQIAEVFVALGVQKIRITGGEPLVRRNITQLLHKLGQLTALQELTLTTNGSQLKQYAQHIFNAGIKRINVSLDSLQPDRFKALTRTGNLDTVMQGIQSARQVGLKVKINSVILRHKNADEVVPLINFAIAHNMDISFIEEMPLGLIDTHQRANEFISSKALRQIIEQHYELSFMQHNDSTSGPSRYWQVKGHTSKIGFISPHSENFCLHCNRVRLTATGQLLLCLGNEHSVDLKALIRRYPNDTNRLKSTIMHAMQAKPEKHHFTLDDEPQIVRFMNASGG